MTTKTKTKVFLADDNTFTVANNDLNISGSAGTETVNILGYMPITEQLLSGIEVDQNIEKINFSFSSSEYRFAQTGNALNVFDASGEVLIALIPVQEDGTDLTFGDGGETFTVKLSSAAIMTIGDAVIGNNATPLIKDTRISTTKAPWTLIVRQNDDVGTVMVSNGTTSGTKILSSSSDYYFQTDSDKTKAFFTTQIDALGKNNLIATDGETTTIIQSNSRISTLNSSQIQNKKVIFSFGDSYSPNGILVSDGTISGTILSSVEFAPSYFIRATTNYNINDLANGNYWFIANSSPYGQELGLLKINPDGTATSGIIKDINPGNGSSIIQDGRNLIDFAVILNSGKLVFSANPTGYTNPNNYELWVSDGTDNGTVKINYDGVSQNYSEYQFSSLGNKVIFTNNSKLAVTDGTNENTHFIGEGISNPIILESKSNTVYFQGRTTTDNISINSLYSINGDVVTKIMDVSKSIYRSVSFLSSDYFIATDDLNEKAIYSITESIATKISSITGSATFLKATPEYAFFTVNDPISGNELWVADKNTSSFHIVKDILQGSGSGLTDIYIENLITVGNKILFSAYINASQKAFFISDGTENGTVKISDYVPSQKLVIGNTLIFSDYAGVHSVNTSITQPVTVDLNTFTNISNSYLQNDNDQVFFTTPTGDLYATTGEIKNTVKLGSHVTQFRVFAENAIYFMENNNDNKTQSLWYSDGTINGTHFVSNGKYGIPSSESDINPLPYYDLSNATVIHTIGTAP